MAQVRETAMLSWLKHFFGTSATVPAPRDPDDTKPPYTTITRYDPASVKTFCPLMCPGYEVTGSFTLKEIEIIVRETAPRHPGAHLLATLDDLHQAFYTSGHAIHAHDLDRTDGHDISGLPASCFEAGEHRGHFSTPEELPIRLANMEHQICALQFSDLKTRKYWTPPDGPIPSVLSADLSSVPREKRSLIQIVPVSRAADALVALPNGYFHDDFSPAENLVLARYLEDEHGWRLFGVGATYLGFMRDTPMSQTQLARLSSILAELYKPADPASTDAEPPAVSIQEMLTGRTVFYLGYGDR